MKAIEGKSYGSIPHLPGSKRGPSDKGLGKEESARLTDPRSKHRQKGDTIAVQEKLDGSNVAVARIGGRLLAIGRRGYLAQTSPFKMHHLFAHWVRENEERFAWLQEGCRACGEWLAQAHSTRYTLPHGPFVAFDIITGKDKKNRPIRETLAGVTAACREAGLPTPHVIHQGEPLSTEDAMAKLGQGGHGAIEPPEGAVWRLENGGRHMLIAKFVRPESEPGQLLPEMSGKPAVWNWRPL